MSEFIPITNTSKVPQLKLQDIGKSTGFLGLGRKVYLVYDTEKQTWGLKSLNVVQRLLRSVFGCYKETTKDAVRQKLTQDSTQDITKNLLQYSELTKRIEDIWKIKLPLATPSTTPGTPKAPSTLAKTVSREDLLHLLKPKSGDKGSGGKEIQKVIIFDQWLQKEYTNKQSPTYKAYQSLAQSEKLDKALFVGVRGDGDCGFRAMIASMLLQLTVDPECSEKFCELKNRLKDIVAGYENAIPEFALLNKECLQRLEQCGGDPKEIVTLINDDQFISRMTRVFRFLSNAILIKDFDSLPEGMRLQLEYGDGVEELGGVYQFLKAHATLDVENCEKINPHLFAGITQIKILCDKLGVGYWVGIVDEGNPKPQQPNISTPKDPLLTISLLCRDTRHFDVIILDSAVQDAK